MTQRGIYAAPCQTDPKRDRVDTKVAACKEMRLWIVEFSIKDIGNGCAVVKADNPKQAEVLLKTQGTFNGLPHLYSITRIEEIIPSPDSMLICEQLATNVKDLN